MPWSEIFRFFYVIGFVNSIFFSVLIFSKKEKSVADRILGIWLIILSIQFLIPFLYLADFEKYLKYVGYEALLFILHPIFLYHYIQSLTKYTLTKNAIAFSVTLVLGSIISMVPLMLLTDQERVDMIQNHVVFSWKLIPGFLIIITIFGYYIISSFLDLKRHKNRTLHLYSYRDNIDLLWLRRLLVSFTIIFLLSIPVSALLFTFNLSLALSDYIYYSFLVGFVIFLGYWGYQQGTIFSATRPNVPHIEKVSYSNETNEFLKESYEITKVMEKEKPFLDPSLTIHQLANQVNMPPHTLSKVIHKSFHKNFFEFVNEYRINHFKKLISNSKYKNFTILGVALECGFNSKSAFNRIFKEQTGMTPGELKKQIG